MMVLAYVVILACGLLALAYGVVTSREVLAADAGTARMQGTASCALTTPGLCPN